MKNFDFILFSLHHWILLWFSFCTWKTETGKRAGNQPSQTLNTKRSWAGLSARPISLSTSSHRERKRRRLKRRVLRDYCCMWGLSSPFGLHAHRPVYQCNDTCDTHKHPVRVFYIFLSLETRRRWNPILCFAKSLTQ